jgi:AAA+ superfamily predicted ATPase
MELTIPVTVLRLIDKKKASDTLKELLDSTSWRGFETVESGLLEPEDYDLMKKACDDTGDRRGKVRGLSMRLATLISIRDGNAKPYINLENLAEAIREYVKGLPNNWIFSTGETGELVPYLVTDVNYSPPRDHGDWYEPARVSVSALAIKRGDRTNATSTIERSEFGDEGVTPAQALALMDFMPSNEDLVWAYEQSLKAYEGLRQKVGLQMVAAGKATTQATSDSYYWRKTSTIVFDKGGVPARVVLDDIYVYTHVDNVDEYVYDRRAFDRVVIPAQHKDMIDAMVQAGDQGDDLIAGKGVGKVILSSGPPGTGKTLTAEAYSQRARKPLYSVQCSQLGLDPETIEKELAEFLDRCKRWGAIGLIDEADVFIRERGDDLTQNAVVGVFLRVLEYYQGVLFLTTNRKGLVDDAILSRCIIHVKYGIPDEKASMRIWRIMMEQFQLVAEDSNQHDGLIEILSNRFIGCSPRTIKQLCRLSKVMSTKGRTVDLELFEYIAEFQDVERSGKDMDEVAEEKQAKRLRRALLDGK